ncbi:MAG: lipopolysaccharide assembly protein LapB [Gammaproteobacteria bacterium]|nr:lipopolysaccharide assembly protein LapB [Gammaproteobacteria bacterium]
MSVEWLLWLLLPVAAWSGWFAATRSAKGAVSRPASGLRSEYVKGFNYLLNEQPDKALDTFIRALEVDSATTETHLALGNLYRRRGEVDRAIRIHQNLIAHETAGADARFDAVLELGQDYLSAGLLDRAEDLFKELVEARTHKLLALQHLIDIYEQEKDWPKAIVYAQAMEAAGHGNMGLVIAHYWCELAEGQRQSEDHGKALQSIGHSLDAHAKCARASLLQGDILQQQGKHGQAIASWRQVEEQDATYLPEVVPRLAKSAAVLRQEGELAVYLRRLLDVHGGTTAMLALAHLIEASEGAQAAAAFVREHLRRRPSVRGLHRLIELELKSAPLASASQLQVLLDLTEKLLSNRPVYQCNDCGFPAKSLHWQCPGCKHWSSVKPIQGVEGE